MTIAPERAPARSMAGCPSRRSAAPTAASDAPPKLADGVRLLGEYAGTGYVEPQYLASRGGGQQVQLSKLLHLVADECDGRSSYDDIAERVSRGYGQTVTADNVRTLVDDKLRPLGVLADASGRSPDVPESDPLLGLKLRRQVLGPRAVNAVAALATPIFWPPVVLAVILGIAAADYWLFFVHGVGGGLRATVEQPAVFLLIMAVIVVSTALHELGHAAACRYSGGRPGGMGLGVYIIWPAFYTDVTDAYQLDRRGRLRTDLGGVYVNAIVVLALLGTFALTQYEPLVLLMFLIQVQVLQQMLPFLRLDGYYVVSDLVGVPDLFRRIGPVLRSAIPFRAPEPEVAQLKPWVRRAVTAWVVVLVPVLLLNLGYLVLSLPRMVATGVDSGSRLIGELDAGGAATAWSAVQLGLLVLPAVGITYTMLRTTRRASAGAWRWSAGSPPRRLGVGFGGFALLSLLALAWWPDGRFTPYREGERGTVQQHVTELQAVGAGTPMVRSPEEAQQPLDPVRPGSSAVVDGEGNARTDPSGTSVGEDGTTTGNSTTTGTADPTTTDMPTPGADTSPAPQESPAAEPSSEPSPEPATSAEPVPSPSF